MNKEDFTKRPWLPYARVSFVFGLMSLLVDSLILGFSYRGGVYLLLIPIVVISLPVLMFITCAGVVYIKIFAIHHGLRAKATDSETIQRYQGIFLGAIFWVIFL